MVLLGIGIKVSTLPVIALGVGIGVDYALYLLSVNLSHLRAGLSLSEAYRRAVLFTGKVVALVGITLAGAVITWAWSPIKFQADMGILLAFMFFYNMIGALILIPALSYFLLGRVDEQGNVYLVGVKKDVITSGGKVINPEEVEKCIIQIDGVDEVAAIGITDDQLGESVATFVVKSPEADITENDIIDFCKTRIASYMVPKSIKFVDQLPRSLGKVVKKILREQYAIKKE
jgi:uncharacterized membrane protein YdfJ with MMPL/SSD domain